MKVPEIDLSECILCEICIDLSPDVFRFNDLDFIEVANLENYRDKEIEIDEAIKNCPKDCIKWVE